MKDLKTAIIQGIKDEFVDLQQGSSMEGDTGGESTGDTHSSPRTKRKRWACKELWRLSDATPACVKVVLADGIDVLVGAMSERVQHLQVQEYGCKALQNLAGDEQLYVQHNCECIAAAGGIAHLIKVLEYHDECTQVLEQACGAISNLARDAECKIQIVRAGGIGLLMRMVVSDKAMLQERAVGALLNIGWSRDDAAHLQLMSANGGAVCLELAMNAKASSCNTKLWAKTLLAKIKAFTP